MRIITGIYKGRRFDVPRTFKARPTTDFAKENIFNVMQGYIDFEGVTALDLFSGTGSISLELLSRECAHVVSVEADRDHARFLGQCIEKLGVKGSHSLIRGDAFKFISSCRQQFDFIFADPPYANERLPEIPGMVLPAEPGAHSILKPGGVFVFEHGKNNDFSDHPCFVERRVYGSVNFSIFQNKEER